MSNSTQLRDPRPQTFDPWSIEWLDPFQPGTRVLHPMFGPATVVPGEAAAGLVRIRVDATGIEPLVRTGDLALEH